MNKKIIDYAIERVKNHQNIIKLLRSMNHGTTHDKLHLLFEYVGTYVMNETKTS